MQEQHTTRDTEREDFSDSSIFNVVIAYEDFETGKAAKRTYDYIAANITEECEFAQQMWKFDVLGVPKLRSIATADAVAADVIIISCHGGELPAAVRSWCDGWIAQKSRAMTLVALLDGEPEPVATATQYLQRVAERAGIEFFTPEMVLAGDDHLPTRSAATASAHGNRLFPLPGGISRSPQTPSEYDAGL